MGIFLCVLGVMLIIAGIYILSKSKNEEECTPAELNMNAIAVTSKPKQPSTEKRGIAGETLISQLLVKLPKEYHVMNDLLLSSGKNSIQIDHVVISPFGIFCIETKNWKGKILGSANSELWTQYVQGHQSSYRNPLLQNNAHVSVLQDFLSSKKCAPIFSIVVFATDATLQITNLADKELVITKDELLYEITQKKDILLNEEQMCKTIEILTKANIIDTELRQKHVEGVKAKAELSEAMSDAGICPRCGSTLILKAGANGNFWACSSYPDCKYTKNV